VQVLPPAQVGFPPPPQSTSVSVPFFWPSRGEGPTQRPAPQDDDWQSEGNKHCLPSAQGGAKGPPQSTSVSVPFFCQSSPGAWHVPDVQTRLAQSRKVPHRRPSAHEGARVPPQSMSLSSPFRTRSSDRAAWHRSSAPPVAVQTPERQSRRVKHFWPTSHPLPWIPPQSTSVSSSFITPSLKVASAHAPDARHTPDGHWLPRTHTRAIGVSNVPLEGARASGGAEGFEGGGASSRGAREPQPKSPTSTNKHVASAVLPETRRWRTRKCTEEYAASNGPSRVGIPFPESAKY